ncbi:MAG: hypothetical protein H0X40_15265 [Chthoniobacterales bacterium]|nr:hypothetical protein [Chthoniobacterales bacterium]
MEITNANAIIQLLVDHQQEYPETVQRQLLEGLYEIAAACLETFDAQEDADADLDVRREIAIAAHLIEEHLISGELTDGFLVALDCFNKAAIESHNSALRHPWP